MARDPVCGMTVDDKKAEFKSEHMGTTYYFCSRMCKATFDENPEKCAESGGHSGHSRHSGSCCCC